MARTGLGGLLRELKRRNVVRVALVYAAVAFVIAQVADIFFPALHLPAWGVTFVVVLLLLGFPIALVLAWAFEITPEGLVRTQGSSLADAREPSGPRGRAAWIAGGAVLGAAVVAAAILGSGAWRTTVPVPLAASGEIPRSIAVLPFADLSPEGDQAWFSDGISEDLHLHLSNLADLKVIGRTSVMRYKTRDLSAREIGQELEVATLLAGSVRRSGNRVRVNVELIRADTEEQLWAQSFDRDLTATDVFEIQSEIARQIAETLHARLSPQAHVRLARAPTDNLAAYDLYLRGREHNQRLTRPDLERATGLFRQAIRLDPDFALPWAGLALTFGAMDGYHGLGRHWVDSSFVAARRAIELDPMGADGYQVLALAQWNSGRMADAVETYRRTLEIRPSDAESYWGLAFTRWLQGELAEAFRLASQAVELDPAHPGYATLLGRTHAGVGDDAAAEHWYRRALELQADFPWAHQDLLWLLVARGEVDRAREHLRTIVDLPTLTREYSQGQFLVALVERDYVVAREWYDGEGGQVLGGIVSAADAGFVVARTGDPVRARRIWNEAIPSLMEQVAERPEDSWPVKMLARTLAAAGETEDAITQLERAVEMGWLGYPWLDIAGDPVLGDLLADPRMETLRRRILDRIAEARAEVEASR